MADRNAINENRDPLLATEQKDNESCTDLQNKNKSGDGNKG